MRFQWSYAVPVMLGLVVLWVFPVARHLKSNQEKARYYLLQLFTMLGAIAGAKLAAMMGDLGWPFRVDLAHTFEAMRTVGRSITGGLLGGFAVAEAMKPLLGYRQPPNDRFATLLPFTFAQGRIGCLLTGCCAGLPHEGVLSMRDHEGVARWPTQAFEFAFHLGVGLFFLYLLRRKALQGRLFALFLVLYGCFRFGTEFLRETPKWWGPLSAYQLLAVLMILLGLAQLRWRRVPTESEAAPATSAA